MGAVRAWEQLVFVCVDAWEQLELGNRRHLDNDENVQGNGRREQPGGELSDIYLHTYYRNMR